MHFEDFFISSGNKMSSVRNKKNKRLSCLEQTSLLSSFWSQVGVEGGRGLLFKVHLTPNFFLAKMKLCNIHIKNLIILSGSGIFKGFKN